MTSGLYFDASVNELLCAGMVRCCGYLSLLGYLGYLGLLSCELISAEVLLCCRVAVLR